MRYAKLINGLPSYAPNPILIDGVYIGNPPGSVYEAEGYKPVVFTDPPETEPGYVAVEGWEETTFEIVQTWTVEAAPITEEEALLRYTNEITGEQNETLNEATETLIKKVLEVQ